MILERHEQGALYATIINENPALALAEANGYVAKVRKNWVLFEIGAYPQRIEGTGSEDTFIGLTFKPVPATAG